MSREPVPQCSHSLHLGHTCRVMSAHVWLLLLLWCHSSSVNAQQLPGPPASCTPDIISSIDWGAGTGSFGIEGATKEGGRAPSVWDTFQQKPGVIAGGATGDVAIDFYHRYKGDIALMQQLGLRHLRLSLSWSRLLPQGTTGSAVNPEAVKFYSSVLDALAAAGIKPMVVLYHWDLPQSLQDSYNGFLSPQIIDDFTYYADTAFRLFGGRVQRWLTFIEPYVICDMHYGSGQYAPGVNNGDEGRYKCGHNLLLAHAAAVQLYRQRYHASQGGQLSFSTLVTWPEPATATQADQQAAQNRLDAEVGWFLDPVFFGDYPASLRKRKGQYLPEFTPQQKQQLIGSVDFIAANAFTAKWVSAKTGSSGLGWQDSKTGSNGQLIGAATGVPWMNVVPWSQPKMIEYLTKRYRTAKNGSPAILISSSGTQVPGEEGQQLPGVLQDTFRMNYYKSYIDSVCSAVASGSARIIGWYAWSLFDGLEWTDGFTRKFGLVHVAYDGPTGTSAAIAAAGGGLKRRPKASARWLSLHFFKRG